LARVYRRCGGEPEYRGKTPRDQEGDDIIFLRTSSRIYMSPGDVGEKRVYLLFYLTIRKQNRTSLKNAPL